jgi:hypothetical protein
LRVAADIGLRAHHNNHINRRQNRVAHLGAHQPSAVGLALHRVQRQIKQFHEANIWLA